MVLFRVSPVQCDMPWLCVLPHAFKAVVARAELWPACFSISILSHHCAPVVKFQGITFFDPAFLRLQALLLARSS